MTQHSFTHPQNGNNFTSVKQYRQSCTSLTQIWLKLSPLSEVFNVLINLHVSEVFIRKLMD